MNKEEAREVIGRLPVYKKEDVYVGTPPTHDKHWVAIMRDDDTTVNALAIRTKMYSLVQNSVPLLSVLDSIEGEADVFLSEDAGKVIGKFYPTDERFTMSNSGKIGIVTYNAVDGSWSLGIRFSITQDNRTFVLPAKVAAFKKTHKGSIQTKMQDYVSMLGKIKNIWTIAIEKLTVNKVGKDEVDDFCKAHKCGEDMTTKIKMLYPEGDTYWNMSMAVYDEIAKSKSSDINRQLRLDNFVETMLTYGFLAKLM